MRDERTTRTFAAGGGAAGGGGADVQARSLDARVAFEKTCTNERKIQSFFVIFKFIKIQKRKKKRRGKKE